MNKKKQNQQAAAHSVYTSVNTFFETNNTEARKNVFDDLMEEINEHFGVNPPDELTQTLQNHLTAKNDGDDLRRLGYYYERIERYSEAVKWYKESYQLDKSYKSLHNLARLSSYMNDLPQSLKFFEECLQCEISNPLHLTRITYNYCFTLSSLTGDYKKANKVSADLTKLYDNVPNELRDKQYWLDVGDHYLYNLSKPVDAVAKYEKGLCADGQSNRDDIEILLGLVNACNKCVAVLSMNEDQEISSYKRKARSYFAQAHKMLKEAPIHSNVKLADLYFYNRNIEEARKSYEAILRKHMSAVGDQKGDIYYFLGLCNLYSENYKEAIKHFDESIHKNQVTYITIHLAQCHLKLANFQDAEDLFDRIIHAAPNNTNALIGQVFLYMDWAESVKTSNAEKSANYLDKSIQTAMRLLSQSNDPSFQRVLTLKEVHELKYSISYCFLEKSKLLKSKQGKIDCLEQAKSYLADLVQQNNNAFYFRSNRTLGELDRILEDFSRNKQSTQRPLIRAGLIAALLALFMLFVGRPKVEVGYQLDTDILAAQLSLKKASIDSIFHDKRFSNEKEMASYVKVIYANKLNALKRPVIIAPKNGYLDLSLAAIDTGVIIFVMSVSIVFTMLGVLSNEIKVLKVGVIHIEKSEHLTLMDQIELKMSR